MRRTEGAAPRSRAARQAALVCRERVERLTAARRRQAAATATAYGHCGPFVGAVAWAGSALVAGGASAAAAAAALHPTGYYSGVGCGQAAALLPERERRFEAGGGDAASSMAESLAAGWGSSAVGAAPAAEDDHALAALFDLDVAGHESFDLVERMGA